MSHISKSFGGVEALRGVDFTLRRGEIHALVGENGAGKSTLMKIIAGVHSGFDGEMLLDGKPVHFHSARDALKHGIGMVHQELSVVPQLTVAENVYLGVQPVNRMGVVDWPAMAKGAREQLNKLGLDLDPKITLGELPIGIQQLVELSRVLFSGASIIILDEPTSALSPPEIERLFRSLRKLRDDGNSLVFISHFLEDVLSIADQITIFRNGRKVVTSPVTPEIDKAWIIQRMIGKGHEELESSYLGDVALASPKDAPSVLEAHGLGKAGAFSDVDLTVKSGEILGIYGFMGCGQIELARALFGKLRCDEGTLSVDGKPFRLKNTAQAADAGIAYVPESRRSMLFHHEPIYKNMSIAILKRLSRLWLKPDAERAIAAQAHRSSEHQDAGNRGFAGQSLRRQPAEGRRRQMVDLSAQGADPERADARHGCRRQGGCGEDRSRLARSGGRRGGDLHRAGDGAGAGRPDHGDAQRVRLAGIRQ